jgi:hypothetical protein
VLLSEWTKTEVFEKQVLDREMEEGVSMTTNAHKRALLEKFGLEV